MTNPSANPEPLDPKKIQSILTSELFGSLDSSRQSSSPTVLYLPGSHYKALSLEVSLVVGMRGGGKSFWWSALQDSDWRKLIGRKISEPRLEHQTVCVDGYGIGDDHPTSHTFKQLLDRYGAHSLWWAIIAWQLLKDKLNTHVMWSERIDFILSNREDIELQIKNFNRQAQAEERYYLVVFDALDRTYPHNWQDCKSLLKGLLQNILEFQPYKQIKLKVFVREDMMKDEDVTAFPDASKIKMNSAELSWTTKDLYNLLWTYMGNTPVAGEFFRCSLEKRLGLTWSQENNIWVLPSTLEKNTSQQRELFHQITGPWMGNGPKRGFPYTWLVNHLGDKHQRVSPRTFLSAIKNAAELSKERGSEKDGPYALYFKDIQEGVAFASQTRVNELKEEYDWLGLVFLPLQGLVIPCKREEIFNRWEQDGTLQKFPTEPDHLPPRSLGAGSPGLLNDLLDIGILSTMTDGRIDLPDVYRVGFSLRRRGGIKPVK